jgi:hypothetical protein
VGTVKEFAAFNRVHEKFLHDVGRIKRAESLALKASKFFEYFISPAFFFQPGIGWAFRIHTVIMFYSCYYSMTDCHECHRDMLWNFLIFISNPEMISPCKFRPKNDAMVISPLFQCPLLISEVASQEDESDRWRMLLEAILVAQAGQFLMKNNERYFVVAIYLTARVIAERFVVAQTGEYSEVDRKVYHVLTTSSFCSWKNLSFSGGF